MSLTRRTFFRATGMGALAARIIGPSSSVDASAAQEQPSTSQKRAEHQVEVFYDVHITPWLQLAGDLQIIRPNRPGIDTAIVPGGRLRMAF